MFDTADIHKTTKKLLNRIKNIDKAAGRGINKNRNEALQIVKDQMLFGRTGKSKLILPQYQNPNYAREKRELGFNAQTLIVNTDMFPSRPIQTPNLFLTGDFHRGMFLNVNGDEVGIGSSDDKSSKLSKKYGKYIFEVSDEGKDIFWGNYLRDYLYNYLINGLQLY